MPQAVRSTFITHAAMNTSATLASGVASLENWASGAGLWSGFP